MESIRTVILVPAYQGIRYECQLGLDVLERDGYSLLVERQNADIVLARSRLASTALQKGFDNMLWIDSDMCFDPTSVRRLLDSPFPIIGGAYVKKGQRAWTIRTLAKGEEWVFGESGGPREVEYSGFGFLLTRRVVFTTLIERGDVPVCVDETGETIYPFFLPVVREGQETGRREFRLLSEDFSFCHRARQAGFAVHIDTSIKLGHVGSYIYTWDFLATDAVVPRNLRVHMDSKIQH
jgi:hypothetical protein